VPDVDSIGVPVFGALRGNSMFVPEMDGDFRIRKMLEFYNEQGFSLHYDLPADFQNSLFETGSSTPIPFWINQECHVILGDADKEEPERLFGREAKRNRVLLDIARLLDDARSGRINDRFDEWAADAISDSYADVFHEPPTRARYWVTRYRIAVAKARQMTQPPHPIDVRLRQIATDWFHRFGSKTELSKIGGMLGTSKSAIFSKRQMTDILFAFLLSKFIADDWQDIELYLREPSLHKAFPGGLYYHYIEHGWPRVPFDYARQDIFVPRMMEELLKGAEREDFSNAAKLCFLLFGRQKTPEQIDSLARGYLGRVVDEFKRLKFEAEPFFKDRREKEFWKPYADSLLACHAQMLDLDGIVNGTDRMKREPVNNRFGVSLQYLKDLKAIQNADW
jgi:hypothetical protein